MSTLPIAHREAAFVSPVTHAWRTVAATTLMTVKRDSAYLINVVRAPLLPAVLFLAMFFAYDAAGRETAGGANVAGFLLVGIFGLLTWQASIWSSGHSLETERWEGTIASLFHTPASRAGVIAGYGLGGMLFLLPSAAVVGVLALMSGAAFAVTSAGAVGLGIAALLVASVATGFAFASLFLLTRRANLMANVVQHPAMLLCGFFVPRSDLPDWLMPFSNALPVSHALDAFRRATLEGADAGAIASPLAWALAVTLAYAMVGALGLRRIEHASKRSGQLDLY